MSRKITITSDHAPKDRVIDPTLEDAPPAVSDPPKDYPIHRLALNIMDYCAARNPADWIATQIGSMVCDYFAARVHQVDAAAHAEGESAGWDAAIAMLRTCDTSDIGIADWLAARRPNPERG